MRGAEQHNSSTSNGLPRPCSVTAHLATNPPGSKEPSVAVQLEHSGSSGVHDTQNSTSPDESQGDGVCTIYDQYSPRRRNVILATVATASVLVPMTDTIYLPALEMIGDDLHTDQALVAASVAIYLFMVGVAALVWGPASDRYGRKMTFYVSFAAYLASTIVCIFAPNIGVLVAFRALQGAAVAAFITNGTTVVADIFPPEQRGIATGYFMIPLLFGPILGPLIGGGLSQAFGWRSTFIFLAFLAGVVLLPLVVFLVPETHQQLVIKHLEKSDPSAYAAIKGAKDLMELPIVFQAPWVPLKYLGEREIAPHAVVLLMLFGCMFSSLTEFSVAAAADPYNLSVAIIGVAFLPMGVAGLVGSPIGGALSDKTAAAHPSLPEARLIHNTLIAMIFMPGGLVLFGWTFQYELSLAGPLVGHFLIGVASAAFMPGIFGYISTIKQEAAGAATGAVQAIMFMSAGILIQVSSSVVAAIGTGPWFTILAGVQLLVTVFAYFVLLKKRNAVPTADTPAVAEP